MRKLLLKVEIIAGTDIGEAAEELCKFSQELNAMLESNFNGVLLLVTPRTTTHDILYRYDRAIRIEREKRP